MHTVQIVVFSIICILLLVGFALGIEEGFDDDDNEDL